MLTLDEILRTFTARRTMELPTQAAEPLIPRFQRGEAAPVLGGVMQLIGHLAEAEKRIAALEARVAELEKHELGNR